MKIPELPPFDHQPKKYAGLSADEVLRLRKEFLNPGIFLYYKKPIMFVEGKMQYLWDDHGRRYLDALGGIVTVSVGHCHPHVVEVARRQNETLQHSTTIYLHPNIAEYAQKLAAKMPGSRILDSGFLNSVTAVAVPLNKPAALAYVSDFIEEAKASGAIRRAFDAIGLTTSMVAPAGMKP